MKVIEALTQAGYVTNPMFQAMKNYQLMKDLQTHPDAEWRFFAALCERYVAGGPNPWHPERVAEVAKYFADSDQIEDLELYLRAALGDRFDAWEFLAKIDPALDLKNEYIVLPNTEVIKHFTESPHFDGTNLIISDGKYKVPSEALCARILKASPSHRFKFISESRDCDGFMLILMGWLAEQGHENLTVRGCYFKGYDADDNLVRHHAVILMLYYDVLGNYKFKIAEPQTDSEMWSIEDGEPGYGIVRTEYTDVFF